MWNLDADMPADRQYLANKTDIGAYFSAYKGMSDVADASAALDPENSEFLLQLVGVSDGPFMMG